MNNNLRIKIQNANFLKIKETLTRIGTKEEDTIYQVCFILCKRGKYYLMHYKELLRLDGLPEEILEEDISHRDAIARLLEQWNLIELWDPTQIPKTVPLKGLFVVKFKDKNRWTLNSPYRIGVVDKYENLSNSKWSKPSYVGN